MRQRSFLLLLAATVVAAAAAGRTLVQEYRAGGPVVRERPAFPGLASHLGELTWLRVVHGGGSLDFASIGGIWTVVERDNYPAAQHRVERLLRGLADLVLVAPKTRRPALFGRLGLDDRQGARSTLANVQDRTGKTVAALIIGRARFDPLGGGDEVYVRRPGDDQSWLARGALPLPARPVDWLDRRILDIPASRIASVALTGADGAVLRLRRSGPEVPFAPVDAPAGARVRNAAALTAPARALAGLDLDAVRPAVDLPVPDGGVATATVAMFDGLTIALRLFAASGHDWLTVAASGRGAAAAEAAALDARLGRWVYAVPAERARGLRTRLADLLAPAKGM